MDTDGQGAVTDAAIEEVIEDRDVASAEGAGDGSSVAADDVALVRAFIVANEAGLVPELVGGGSVGEVLASVAAARAAYRRVAEQVGSAGVPPAAGTSPVGAAVPAVPLVPTVPAGGAPAFVVDPGSLPAGELIRRGITAARRG